MTHIQFSAVLARNGFSYVFPDDNGTWHGTDFLFPGDTIGRRLADLPNDAKVCQNRCCDCYRKPEAN